VKDKHVKNAAQDVAEDVLGAVADGSVKVFIVARVIFKRRNPRPRHAYRPQVAFRRHEKDGHVQDAAQGVAQDAAEDVPQVVAQDLAFGARAARALLIDHATTAAAAAFAQLVTR